MDAKDIIKEKEYYQETSANRRARWVECWKMYMSWMDTTKNPFLANLFIPKTHEAVELLAAFLSGPNQAISVKPEGKDDMKKAELAKTVLDFQWRKTLKMRAKIITWIKQAIIFGNGVMKVGWDADKQIPFAEPISLSDIYFDYFTRDIQNSSVIHEIRKKIDDIKNDERYDEIRKTVISEKQENETDNKLSSYDDTVLSVPAEDETVIYERWDNERLITIAPTSSGWQIIRDIPNENKDADGKTFIPFIKLGLKNNPLPNRAYDIGAVEPTIKIQQAFNDMMNEVFDNVSLINNKMWIKRRGANINPIDLVRRPGGVITVENDINNDIKAEEIGDIKSSAIKILEMLDSEFQQASMVVNLLKGIPGADFATEATLGQSNVMTLLDVVDGNIKEALSEMGIMILNINIAHGGKQTMKILENDNEMVFTEVNLKDIKGKYDVKISADRAATYSKIVRQKQLLDFLAIVSRDPESVMKYPKLKEKVYKKWLEEAGFSDIDYFFEQEQQQGGQNIFSPSFSPSLSPMPKQPARSQGLTDKNQNGL